MTIFRGTAARSVERWMNCDPSSVAASMADASHLGNLRALAGTIPSHTFVSSDPCCSSGTESPRDLYATAALVQACLVSASGASGPAHEGFTTAPQMYRRLSRDFRSHTSTI